MLAAAARIMDGRKCVAIKALWNWILLSLKTGFHEGALWFALSSILPPLVSIFLGPLILRKVGLEEYAILGLAAYFLVLVTGYSDFGSNTNLLTVYSKKSPSRHADLGNSVMLKLGLLALFFCVLVFSPRLYPRKDDLYSLMGVFMAGLLLPSAYVEWYFIARRRYFQLFLARVALLGSQILLILTWVYSSWKDPMFLPFITLVSGMVGSLCFLWFLGGNQILNWLMVLRLVSFRGMRSLFLRLLPMGASLLLTPYLLAYALPWYSLTCSDKRLVGAFSIAYRLIIGLSSLVAPLVIYWIPKNAALNRAPSFAKTFGLSLSAVVGFWILGVPVLWFYFHLSKVDPIFFPYSIRNFSILLLGVFFLCLRTPYVGQRLIYGQYRSYFLILLISCAPIMALSWVGGKRIPYHVVPWLACLPDFLTTVGFVGYNRFRSFGKSVSAVMPLI